jgi:hypothetical protein
VNDPETRFDAALRDLAARPARTPPPFAAARVVARLASGTTPRHDWRPWLAAAAFVLLGVALHRTTVPTLPVPVPAPASSGVVVFALDPETTLYFALPAPSEAVKEEPS